MPAAAFLSRIEGSLYHLALRVTPGAKKSRVIAPVLLSDSAIGIRIAAPPVEGKANAVVVEFLEEALTQEMKHFLSDPSSYRINTNLVNDPGETNRSEFGGHAPLATSVPISRGNVEDTKHKMLSKQKKHWDSKTSGTKGSEGSDTSKSFLHREVLSLNCPPQSSKVAVTLVKGHTARNKVVAVNFPASEEYLIAMLENISS